ncbi:receptor-like protein 35 [Capsicum annuum]|uniref:receptor-like protein 35 n=1 Tax=Capsicum annuum TaxID=4072 RepID=UPI001FB188C5|nr:receptor-like protein 35 [Capsicum annuum]
MALIGRIPSELGNLSFLVSLDLGSNNFHGNLPQEMACLRRLKFLDLSVNNFSGKVPSLFGLLHHLQVLNLGNNSFTGSIPCSFSNILTLETLNLKFNSIEGQIPKVIGSLAIALSGYLPNGLCNGLPILKGLYLSYNKLHDQMPTSLTNCSQLQILSLSDNEFDGPIHSEIERSRIIPQEIENFVNLAELAMERNQISGSFPISTLSHRCNVCHFEEKDAITDANIFDITPAFHVCNGNEECLQSLKQTHEQRSGKTTATQDD